MTTKVAICNQKGGVGKTTLTINIAGALNALGNDVLLVDLDPQGHATEGLGFKKAYEENSEETDTLFTVLNGDEKALPNVIREHEEMDVVPSNLDMSMIESALLNEIGREGILRTALETVEEEYDHILIDCPPNLGTLTDNAVLAAQNLLIPVQAQKTSIRAIDILFRTQIEPIEQKLSSQLEGDQINIVGIVANQVTTRDNESRDVIKEISDKIPVPTWVVMQRVALQRAWDNGVSIFEYDADADIAPVFLDVAREIATGESSHPDPMIPFENKKGSVSEYLKLVRGDEPVTDGGVPACAGAGVRGSNASVGGDSVLQETLTGSWGDAQ